MRHIDNEQRRNTLRVMTAAGAAALLSGCPWPPPVPNPAKPKTVPAGVDVHCHIFNILDMPAYAFVVDVFLQDPLLRVLAAPWAAMVVEIASVNAKTFQQEKDVLDQHFATNQPLPVAMTAIEVNTAVVIGLKNYVQKYTSFGVSTLPPPLKQQMDDALKVLFDTYLPGVTIDWANPTQAAITILLNIDALVAKIQSAQAANKAAPQVSLLGYVAQFLFYWAPELGKYRFQIADDLSSIHDSTTPLLVCPASLDITTWLKSATVVAATPPPTPLSDQCKLMALISRAQPSNRILHGFVGFDPWRHAVEKQGGITTGALKTVQDAVMTQGFIGVKIYPPMGFRAIGNAALPDSAFKDLMPALPNKGQLLDDALMDLYAWCNANGVPIMAHCAASQGTSAAAEERADPKYWADVLDLTQFKTTLRVNLGHFGGLWAFYAGSTDICWTAAIAKLIQDGGYDFLYTDFGDLADVLGRSGDHVTQIRTDLSTLVNNNAKVRDRVLYGTDFQLLGREPGFEAYSSKMRAFATQALGAGAVANFMGENAVRFFGLAPGEPNRVRLEAFYTANGLDKGKLAQIGG